MHDFTGSVESALGLSVSNFQQVFENLTQHLRVDSHFTFHRLVFAHGEVVTVEDIQNTGGTSVVGIGLVGEDFIRNIKMVRLPVVRIQRLKQTTGKERDSGMKRRAIAHRAAIPV